MGFFKFGNGNRRWYIIGFGMAAFLLYMFVAPKLTGSKGRAVPTPISEYIPDMLPFGGGEVEPGAIPAEMEIPQTTGSGPSPMTGMRLAGAGYVPSVADSFPYRSRIIVS